MSHMDSVVHFEMPAKDRNRVSKFYSSAFGWKMEQYGPDMGNYITAQTGPTDDNRMPQKPGFINGGFFTHDSAYPRLQHPSIVIAVDNIEAAIDRVTKAGGNVLGGQKPGEPDNIPGVGRYIAIEDSEGNRVGILQPKMPASNQ